MDDEFEQLTRDLQDAVRQQDRARLEALVAPGFRLITSRAGNPASRDDWIAAATGPFHVRSYELGDCHVIRAGETTVVAHHLTQDAHLGDRPAARHWLTTDVWTRASGTWQIMARHTEALPE